ncbi:transcriptional regulator [Paenibacillus taihuensis]|uniref:Transcriptional regulator n=1 Tax=Paenibacillus taihuensis TaxID=1156355 RepID=A0A3D9QC61_9BACL|nr:transcriptional regulator [Paenibacillus taihuensis]
MIKPCSPPILQARAKRLLGNRQILDAGDTLSGGGITLHLPSRTVTLDGKPCSLTHTEFELLACLLRNKGIILTRDQLITKIWGYDFDGDDRTLSSHIRNLRSKLEEHAAHIVTVIRSGYKFEELP